MTDLDLALTIETTIRIDRAVLAHLIKSTPTLSRAHLKPLFTQNRILLAKRPVKAALELPPGQYTLTILGWDPVAMTSQVASASINGCFLPVIYEDDDLLVLHKFTGVPSIPHSALERETAVGAVLARIPNLSMVGRGGLEPAIIHRLDTSTSGLLVFAKTNAEFERLRGLWKDRKIRKIYRAVVGNSITSLTPLTIDTPLAHDAKSAKRMVALTPNQKRLTAAIRGKPLKAITHILDIHPCPKQEGLDLKIEIETGVMHQIRCHLASIGHPICGDKVYHGPPADRLWLHAWRLHLPLVDGVLLKLEAALPPGWPM